MSALQDKYGIDQILELNDRLVLIGKDWCYKSDDGLQLVERELAAKTCAKLAENNRGKYVESRKLEKGSMATDWNPSPEDKINVSDMRKPEI